MRLTIQKATFILAIFAWLMQLSVFITPILQKHPELGVSICKQVTVVTQQSPFHHAQLEHAQLQPHESVMLAEQSIAEEKDLYQTDPYCKFCLVFGQNFNPILFVCLFVLVALTLCKHPHRLYISSLKLHKKLYLTFFQNRAPPVPVVFIP